jgi:apolipoprotein N-acyltransferase
MGAERVPFESLFPSLKEFLLDLGGTSGTLGSQNHRSNFTSVDGKMQVAPIICYESIYSDYVTEYVRKGANLLFIITNDGWWQDTPGYKQHFAFARIRAIENRRSIARSANTGISGFINQKGDVLSHTEWWKADAISATINANNGETLFTKFPYLIGGIAVISTFILLLLTTVQLWRKKAVK